LVIDRAPDGHARSGGGLGPSQIDPAQNLGEQRSGTATSASWNTCSNQLVGKAKAGKDQGISAGLIGREQPGVDREGGEA
jgi:hypothetical protein